MSAGADPCAELRGLLQEAATRCRWWRWSGLQKLKAKRPTAAQLAEVLEADGEKPAERIALQALAEQLARGDARERRRCEERPRGRRRSE